jgi:hypothetical protein
VPALTVAGDYTTRKRLETKPEKVDAFEWFPEDFQIRYKKIGNYGSNAIKLLTQV